MASSRAVRWPLRTVARRASMSSTELVKSSISSGRSLKPMTKNSSSGLAVLMNWRIDSRARISLEVMEPERSKMMPIETGASSLAKLDDLLLAVVFVDLEIFLLKAGDQPVHGIGDGDGNQHHVHIHADQRAGASLGGGGAGDGAALQLRQARRWPERAARRAGSHALC